MSAHDRFIELCNIKYNYFFDYSLTVFTGAYNPVIIICPMHGEKTMIALDHYLYGCPGCKSKCISISIKKKFTELAKDKKFEG
jgi:hypothetical protein